MAPRAKLEAKSKAKWRQEAFEHYTKVHNMFEPLGDDEVLDEKFKEILKKGDDDVLDEKIQEKSRKEYESITKKIVFFVS